MLYAYDEFVVCLLRYAVILSHLYSSYYAECCMLYAVFSPVLYADILIRLKDVFYIIFFTYIYDDYCICCMLYACLLPLVLYAALSKASVVFVFFYLYGHCYVCCMLYAVCLSDLFSLCLCMLMR